MAFLHSVFISDVALLYLGGAQSGYGSGRLIAPSLVITAGHVIETAEDSTWNVLFLKDQHQDGTWGAPHNAKLVWRGHGHQDVALLQIVTSEGLPDLLEPTIPLTFASFDQLEPLSGAYATGFPKGWESSTKTRDFTIAGELFVPTKGDSYGWLVKANPDNKNDWKGMSGAAVCHVDEAGNVYIFGVIQDVPAHFSHGQLDVARISDVFDDPEFLMQLSRVGCSPKLQSYGRVELSPDTYDIRRPYPALTDGVTGNLLASLEAFLSEYLELRTPESKFLGRSEERAELLRWIEDAHDSYLTIVGPAGRGKSALLAHWAMDISSENKFSIIFLPVSLRFGITRRDDLAKLWLQRLRFLNRDSSALSGSPDAWVDEIHTRLRQWEHGPKLLIIIDGLDEAADQHWFRFPPRLNDGIKLIISSRILAGEADSSDVLRRAGLNPTTHSIYLQPLRRHDLTGLDDGIGTKVPEFANILWKLTMGDPLLVRLYSEWIGQHSHASNALLDTVPSDEETGMGRYVRMWWEQVTNQLGDPISAEAKQFLYVLCCALGPLKTDDVVSITNIDPMNLVAIRKPLSRLVIGDGKRVGYTYTHPRIAEYFADEFLSVDQKSAVEGRLLEYCRASVESATQAKILSSHISRYVLLHCVDHFQKARSPLLSYLPLLREVWMLAWHKNDGHYSGYIGDVVRVRDHARQDRSLATIVRCCLAMSTVVSLNEAAPPRLLLLALQEGMISASQALEMIRQRPNEWSRAFAIVTISSTLEQKDLISALEVAREMRDATPRLFAIAALSEKLPYSIVKSIEGELPTMSGDVPALSALFAHTILRKTGRINADIPPELREEIEGVLRSWIYGDMNDYHRRLSEIVIALHPDDQSEFARLVFRAVDFRSYRYREADYAEQLVQAIVDYSPLDLLPELERLLNRSPNPGSRVKLLIAGQYAMLGSRGPLDDALTEYGDRYPCTAVIALSRVKDVVPPKWSTSCTATITRDEKQLEIFAEIVKYSPRPLSSDMRASIREMWVTGRSVQDFGTVTSFGAVAVPRVSREEQARIADRFALQARPQDDVIQIASIGKYVSQECLGVVREKINGDLGALVELSPRFPNQERSDLLGQILALPYLKYGVVQPIARLLNTLKGTERVAFANSVLGRITGELEGWSQHRESGLAWAELIEALAAPLGQVLGSGMLASIEKILPAIGGNTNRALALATLARCFPDSQEGVRLAWTAFLEFARSEGQDHLIGDISGVFSILPEHCVSTFALHDVSPDRATMVMSRLRERVLNSDATRAKQYLDKGDLLSLKKLWRDALADLPTVRLERYVPVLVDLCTTNQNEALALWETGMARVSEMPRHVLLRYLTSTFPVLAKLVLQRELDQIVDGVAELASWAWQ